MNSTNHTDLIEFIIVILSSGLRLTKSVALSLALDATGQVDLASSQVHRRFSVVLWIAKVVQAVRHGFSKAKLDFEVRLWKSRCTFNIMMCTLRSTHRSESNLFTFTIQHYIFTECWIPKCAGSALRGSRGFLWAAIWIWASAFIPKTGIWSWYP